MFEFELGVKIVDDVTGFTGIVCCREEWLNGCIRYGVQAPMKEDGEVPDLRWLDEGQLSIVPGEGVASMTRRTGGPRPPPTPPCAR